MLDRYHETQRNERHSLTRQVAQLDTTGNVA